MSDERITTKILILSSSPRGLASINFLSEYGAIERQLRMATLADAIEVKLATEVNAVQVQELLMREQPQIVHFCGHGSETDGLVFQARDGGARLADRDTIARVFELVGDCVDCVVLNACYSEDQAEVIAAHVGAAIGMSRAIDDRSSVAFSIGFYQALANGQPLEVAFELGKVRAELDGAADADVPVLFTVERPSRASPVSQVQETAMVADERVELALKQLLLKVFSASELRAEIAALGNGHELRAELPGRVAAPAVLAAEASAILVRRGALEIDWFDALGDRFPGRRRNIIEVRDLWADWLAANA